jgi:hypothetical protein
LPEHQAAKPQAEIREALVRRPDNGSVIAPISVVALNTRQHNALIC